MESIQLKAMAKVNLGLDVLGRREDGYHEVKMIMQTIRLYDRLTLTRSEEPGIRLTSTYRYLPTDENNLAVRAARLLMDGCQAQDGLDISLEKKIPVAAGMAGGSTDAAAVLVGVNRLFGLGISADGLRELGVRIGADVPYCLMRGTVLAEGIGEKLTPLAPTPFCHVLIAKPAVSVSTRFVYENLHAETIEDHPDIDALRAAIEKGSLAEMLPHMENVLERVTIPVHPVIGELKEQMMEAGALKALMSGSGPTVFGLFEDKDRAYAAKHAILEEKKAAVAYVTEWFQPAAPR